MPLHFSLSFLKDSSFLNKTAHLCKRIALTVLMWVGMNITEVMRVRPARRMPLCPIDPFYYVLEVSNTYKFKLRYVGNKLEESSFYF